MRYLIIGNSAAGVAAARAIRRADPAGEITIVGDESYPYYGRVLTSYYLGGLIPWERLWLADPYWYGHQRIQLITGQRATGVDAERQMVRLAGGAELPYDRLLVATGAAPQRVDFSDGDRLRGNHPHGAPPHNDPPRGDHSTGDLAGAFTLRTLDDAAAIRRFARPGGQAVIIGGGLVGIKAAEALHALGLKVRLVVSSGRLLSQALDDTGAELVRQAMVAAGFIIHLREDVVALERGNAIEGQDKIIEGQKKVTGAVLRSGAMIPADVVVVGKGVRPNVAFLQGSGVKVNQGVLVNDYLATSIPGIYAAGDVAEAYDRVWQRPRLNALWGNAIEQGRLAGLNMAGHQTVYRGSIGQNALVVGGLGVISGGIVNPPAIVNPPEEGYRVATRLDARRSSYRKAVLQGRRLVGMVAIGPTEGAGSFLSLIGREVREKYVASFLDGSFGHAMIGHG